MYRVVWFYRWCEYSSNIGLLWLTLFRNMSVSLPQPTSPFLALQTSALFALQSLATSLDKSCGYDAYQRRLSFLFFPLTLHL